MPRIRIWQWPNLLALDAALIAVCWQALFDGGHFSMVPATVLALSVWLTYVADRLFDVGKRPEAHLLSDRHRFALRHRTKLWPIWWAILASNVAIALLALSHRQLQHGLVLLSLCLLYTALNQWLSKRFFPKELCVAIIYAGGSIVFLEHQPDWASVCAFGLLCLCNCLLIGQKEQAVDAALHVHSLSKIPGLLMLTLALTGIAALNIAPTILLPWAAIALLTMLQHKTPTEAFRVLADLALMLGPIYMWIS